MFEMDKYKELTEDICILETAEDEVVETENSGLKRKVVISSYSDAEFRYSTSVVKRRIFRRVVGGESEKKKNTKKRMQTSSLNFDPCCSYSSSHNGSTHIDKEASQFSDLEEEQREIIGDKSISSTYGLDSCRERRESMAPLALSDQVIADLKVTGELQPSVLNTEEIENIFSIANVNPSRRSKRAKMPSNAELDDFFSVTENDLMQQFSHKYNFDFVKEEPFEGQYEWVQVKENNDTWNPHHTTTTFGYVTHEQDYNNEESDTWNPQCYTTTTEYMTCETQHNNLE